METSTIIALLGCGMSVATFYIGRQSASKAEGERAGSFATDLRYIKESVERIEDRLNDDVKRLEGRIDELSNQVTKIGTTAARAHESSKSSHHRQDEHLERDHGQKVVKREVSRDE